MSNRAHLLCNAGVVVAKEIASDIHDWIEITMPFGKFVLVSGYKL